MLVRGDTADEAPAASAWRAGRSMTMPIATPIGVRCSTLWRVAQGGRLDELAGTVLGITGARDDVSRSSPQVRTVRLELPFFVPPI